MNRIFLRFGRIESTVFLLGMCLCAGCGQNEARSYSVPRQTLLQTEAGPTAQSNRPPGHPDVSQTAAGPSLTWKLPAGWTEMPAGAMRVASFSVKGTDGVQADVSVIPLPGMAGGDAANINRWRGQVGLPPAPDDELRKAAQPVEVDGQSAELHDLAGVNAGDGSATRILAVVQHRDGAAWFFKMTGNDAFVLSKKSSFIEFLKSLHFAASEKASALPPSHPPIDAGAAGLPAASESVSHPKWQAPSGWKEVSAGQFLVAKYSIATDGGAQAAVNVSKSNGDGGGLEANVNRWREQLGLAPLSAIEVEKQAKDIPMPAGKATLVELNGTDARSGQPGSLAGVVVSRSGQTWFFKLMGDGKVVENQKAAFINFVKGAEY